ncbi:hypothetical protein D3C73_909190 [compost metagenome]
MAVRSAEHPQHGEAGQQAQGVARQGEVEEGPDRRFRLFLPSETRLEDDQVQQDHRQNEHAQRAQRRGHIGDQPHLLGRSQVHGEVEGPGQHQEQLARIGGLILVALVRIARQLASRRQGAQRGGHRLQGHLPHGGPRRTQIQHIEDQQKHSGGDETHGQGDQRIQRIVDQTPASRKPGVMRQPEQHRQRRQQKDETPLRFRSKSERPHLHRHQQGQAEQQRAAEGSAQIADVGAVVRPGGVLRRSHAQATPPSAFGSRKGCPPQFNRLRRRRSAGPSAKRASQSQAASESAS